MKTHFSGLTDLHKIVNAKSWLGLGILVGACLAAPTSGQASIYYSEAIIDNNGGGNFFYNCSNGSDTGNPHFAGASFTIGLGQSFLLGGQTDTYPGSGVTGAANSADIGYILLNGSSTIQSGSINLPYLQHVNGSDDQWQQMASVNAAGVSGQLNTTSLAVGTYTLEVYFYAQPNNSSNPEYDSNGGANWSATLTVVPEPVTLALPIFGGLMLTAGLVRRFACQRANG